VIEDYAVLGSNRLAITDPDNALATMPFFSSDGNIALVFNGEIYNHRELRDELSSYAFRTGSDTETILGYYQEKGLSQLLEKLDGMFSFCLVDKRTQLVCLAVDPAAQKPLFYWYDRDKLFFASEIDPLISTLQKPPSLDREALIDYLGMCFLIGGKTQYREIKRLEGGCAITIDRGQKTSGVRYFQIPSPVTDPMSESCEDYLEHLAGVVKNSCMNSMRLEVPYGILLSGGVDSSLLAFHAHRLGLAPNCYSVGFRELRGPSFQTQRSDEFEYSRAVCKDLGFNHTMVTLTSRDYFESFDRWMAICGIPLASREAPCLERIVRTASEHVKVLFCGSGPDELFDGYGHGALGAKQSWPAPSFYSRAFQWLFGVKLEELVGADESESLIESSLRRLLETSGGSSSDITADVNRLDFLGRLQTYEFYQLDLLTMRYGVEGRSPLCSRELIRAAFCCPSVYKRRSQSEKWIFKAAAAKSIPANIAWRQKEGFPIPSELWFQPEFEERAEVLLDRSSTIYDTGLFNREYLLSLWRSKEPGHRNVFLRLLVLERVLARQKDLPNYRSKSSGSAMD
jgi:asparagine synthase (glutamine-hydrolysing)